MLGYALLAVCVVVSTGFAVAAMTLNVTTPSDENLWWCYVAGLIVRSLAGVATGLHYELDK